MRATRGWLVWRSEMFKGETKPRKVPYYPGGGIRKGRQGSAEDRSGLTNFQTAWEICQRQGFTGVGFAPLPGFGFAALDFDDCIGPNGEIPAEIKNMISVTYAEFSPSGKGIRAIFKGDVGNHKSHHTKNSVRVNDFGFETFSTSGFVTITGDAMPHVELLGLEDTCEFITDEVTALCAKRWDMTKRAQFDESDPLAVKNKLGLTVAQMEEALKFIDPDVSRDEWIKVGMALHHECEGDDTGFEIWNEWSSNGGKYPSEEALLAQWESFDRPRSMARQVTMATVLHMVKEVRGSIGPISRVASAEELMATVPETPAAAPGHRGTTEDFTGKFKIVSGHSTTNEPPPDWLIKHVLPAADLIILYGASGSGKSFVALDMAMSIARGMPWRGHRTIKGRVLVIAAEGRGGVGKRLKAYGYYHQIGLEDLAVDVMGAAPNFLQKDDIYEVVDSVRNAGGYDLVIVDTFAKTTPGANENAGEDMGLALANAQVLREVTMATIMLIHHSGKDATKGARGWSGIKAAADAEIEINKQENGREIRLSKMKDGDDGLAWGFKLEVVETGVDKDNEAVTSCVAIEANLPLPAVDDEPRKNVRKFTMIQQHILEVIETLPIEMNSITVENLTVTAAGMLPDPLLEGKRDSRMTECNTAILLLAKGADAPLMIKSNHVHFRSQF